MPTFSEHLLEEDDDGIPVYFRQLDYIVIGLKGTNNYIQYLGNPKLVDDICAKYNIENYKAIPRRKYDSLDETSRVYNNKIAIIDIDNGYRYEKI